MVMAACSCFAFKIAAKPRADRDMITIDSLQEHVIALFNGTIVGPPTTNRLATIPHNLHSKVQKGAKSKVSLHV